ncbi:MAG TPA: ABC transporter permease [Acidimicrobiales bacterium]|nr:ABC transporter permease [Acidimicrobiales bacterium]
MVVGVAYGARTSLAVALGVVAVAGALAFVVGSAAGHGGGRLDDVLMRLAELVLVVPRFFLAVATVALFGAGFVPPVAVVGLTSWPVPARILRAEILSRRELPYVEAARAMGAGRGRILVHHVLPNSMGPFVVSISLLAGTAILIEAGLAFLGLADADQPSWGTMLSDAQPYLRQAPWVVLFPGAAITLAVLSLNLLGDGIVESFHRGSARRLRR